MKKLDFILLLNYFDIKLFASAAVAQSVKCPELRSPKEVKMN